METVQISIRVAPRAKTTQISGVMEDGSLKVRVSAPPVDGKANQSLIKLLAETFGVSKSSISILSGIHKRNKIVKIEGLSQERYNLVIHQLVG